MRTKKGVISSAKSTGTVTVTVHSHAFHPIYKKRYRKSKKFLADTGDVKDLMEGDTVVITECRPLSKNKHFRVTDVVSRIPRVSDIQEEEGLEKAIHREKEKPVIAEKAEETKETEEAKETNESSDTDSDSTASS